MSVCFCQSSLNFVINPLFLCLKILTMSFILKKKGAETPFILAFFQFRKSIILRQNSQNFHRGIEAHNILTQLSSLHGPAQNNSCKTPLQVIFHSTLHRASPPHVKALDVSHLRRCNAKGQEPQAAMTPFIHCRSGESLGQNGGCSKQHESVFVHLWLPAKCLKDLHPAP